jgi:microcystin-dependent protein
MSYNILTSSSYLSAMYPPGSITAYVNANSSADPSGWVICDGVARGIIDSRYINVVGLGIGSSAGGNYTPPNLRGSFLRGATAAGATYVGPSVKAFQDQQIINHGHTVSNHTHNTIDQSTNFYALRMTANNSIGAVDNSASEINCINNLMKLNNNGNTANTSTVAITSTSNVSGVSGGVETRPYNYGVYWILKL